jgi:nucleotide-binding universal stress UspA family protein
MAEQQHGAGTGQIVVGVDGSQSSRAALRWALDYAALTGKRVTAVSAWQYPHDYGFSITPVEVWHPDTDAVEALEAAVRDVAGVDRPDEFAAITRQGHPTKVLLDLSNDADLLVVGSRGHGGFAGLLLGSVSSALAEHAHCPVLVMH